MFEHHIEPPRRPNKARSTSLSRLWDSRAARMVAAVLVTLLLSLAVAATWAWNRATSNECHPLREADLTVDQLIDIKQRLDTYKRDPRPSAQLEVSDAELAFLLLNNLEIPSEIEFQGSKIVASLALPGDDECTNIEFAGKLQVANGVAVLVPDRVVLGELDLSWLMAGRRIVVKPGQLASRPLAADLLDNTERLEINDGMLDVRFEDPWKVF